MTATPGQDLLTLEISDGLGRAALGALGRDALTRYLSARRWFGAKGQAIEAAGFDEVAPLIAGDDPIALARVAVRFASGHTEHYQVPLAIDREGRASLILANIHGGGVLHDAVESPEFRRQLGRAFAQRATAAAQTVRWEFEPLTELEDLADVPTRVVGGEQSNTSIVFGERAILKLFRHLEIGQNPDVEIGRFLTTRTNFRGTPALLGILHLRAPAGDGVAGMVQEFLPDSTDGWAHVLARLANNGADQALTTELQALGRLTRELHAALASVTDDPDFAPEPTTQADLDRWRTEVNTQVTTTFTQLAAQLGQLPAKIVGPARALLGRAEQLRGLLRGPLHADEAMPRIRHHGDYHLGQVLRTADGGWRIIDFEGEPARPLAERRAKHHPLRDVAGMLRSFAYAAAVAARTDPARDPATAERAMRAAFLAGYDPDLAGDPRSSALLALFETEKALYELRYELGSRPDWAWIPLAGLADLLSARPA